MKAQTFLSEARADLGYLQGLRRDLHREPELGYREEKTALRVRRELESLGLEVQAGLGGTGVLGCLDTGRPGPVTLLRADMDALSLQEESPVSYRSVHPGVMHACGHDVHTAWLVGAARILVRHRQTLQGRVLFLFQPAEESLGGARKVLASGALDGFDIDGVFGAHVWPLEVGRFLLIPGAAMASSGNLRIEIRGQGGHGARPQETRNPVPGAVAIASGLYSLMSAYRDPQSEELLNLCSIRAGEKFNVVPDKAVIEGTFRAFDEDRMGELEEAFTRLADHTARSLGLEAEVSFHGTYPPLINDDRMMGRAEAVIRDLAGAEAIRRQERGLMIAEDFSFYARRWPGAYVMIGAGTDPYCRLHTAGFDVDESVLAWGAAYMALCGAGEGKTTV